MQYDEIQEKTDAVALQHFASYLYMRLYLLLKISYRII